MWGHHAHRQVDVWLRCDCDPALLTRLAEIEEEMTHQVRSSHISVAFAHADSMPNCLQSRFDVIKTVTTATSPKHRHTLLILLSEEFIPHMHSWSQLPQKNLRYVDAAEMTHSVSMTTKYQMRRGPLFNPMRIAPLAHIPKKILASGFTSW